MQKNLVKTSYFWLFVDVFWILDASDWLIEGQSKAYKNGENVLIFLDGVSWKYLKLLLIKYVFDQLLVYIIYFFHRIRLSRILLGQSIGIQIKGRWYSMVNLLGCLCLVFCDWVLFGHFSRMGAILLVDKGNYNFLLL